MLGLEEDDEETFELEALGDGDENLDHVLNDALDTNSDSFDDDGDVREDDAIEAFVIPGDFDDADFFDEVGSTTSTSPSPRGTGTSRRATAVEWSTRTMS